VKDDVLANAPLTGARFEQNTEAARLVETLASIYYRLDTDIDQLRRDRYTETATGTELDRHGREVGVERPPGESNPAFRRRVLAGRGQATSRTTWADFAELVLDVLDCDADQVQMTIDYTDELGAVIVEAESSVIDASPFSESTIVSFLEGALPMSRRVVVRATDVFTWDDPDKGWGTQWGGALGQD